MQGGASSAPDVRGSGAAALGGPAAGTAARTAAARPYAILLLAWIAAIKATGASLSTTALVHATTDLGLGTLLRAACASAVSLTIAATAVAAGVAADRLGRRRVLMGSFVIAGAANLVVLAAPSGWLYFGGHVAAGVGYGAMTTGSYAYVKAVTPGKGLGWGLGLYTVFTTFLCTATIVAGGTLAGASWRLLFLVVPAMCAVAAVLTPRLLPVMPRAGSGPVDLRGLVTLGAGMLLLISGLTTATSAPHDLVAWLPAVAGVALLAAWVALEVRSRHPAFPVRLFRSRRYVAAAVFGLAANMAAAAMALGMSDHLQYVARESVLVASIGLQPSYIVGGLGGLAAGGLLAGRWLKDGVPARHVMAGGGLLQATGYVLLVPLHHGSSYWAILPGTLLAGFGLAAAMTAQAQVIVRCAPAGDYGAVTSSKTSISQLGSALGMILTVLFLDRFTAGGIVRGLRAEGVTPSDAHSTLTALDNFLTTGQKPGLHDLPDAIGHAMSSFSGAFHGSMLLCAAIMVAASAAAWVLMKEPA